MMADSKTTYSQAQTRVSEIFSGKITKRKFIGNNYLQLKRVEIYATGRGKIGYLLVVPYTPKIDSWTLDDSNLLHQILTTMEPKIQDLVLHYVTVMEL
jgi:hypothetical protein